MALQADRQNWFFLAGLITLGAGLRLVGLETQSLWCDEASGWAVFRNDPATIFQELLGQRHPPGFYLLHHFCLQWLGNAEWALRLPEALAGILAIGAIFAVGRRLGTEREGLIAAAFLGVLWFPIYYSQEVRPYSLWLLLCLVSMFTWIGLWQAFRSQVRIQLWDGLGYVLSSAALFYVHYYSFFLVLWQGLTLLAYAWRSGKKLAILAGLYLSVALLLTPWLPAFVHQLGAGTDYWIPPRPVWYPIETLRFFFNRSGLLTILVLLIGLAAFFPRLWGRHRHPTQPTNNSRDSVSVWVSLAWLVFPTLGAALFSIWVAPILTHRNLMVVAPAAYLLLAQSIVRLPLARRFQNGIAIFLLAFSLIEMIAVSGYYVRPTKEQNREAVQALIQKEPEPSQALLLGFGYMDASPFAYYLERAGYRPLDLNIGETKDLPALDGLVDQRQPNRIWYLEGFRKPEPAFLDSLKERFHLEEEIAFFGVTLYRFNRVAERTSFDLERRQP